MECPHKGRSTIQGYSLGLVAFWSHSTSNSNFKIWSYHFTDKVGPFPMLRNSPAFKNNIGGLKGEINNFLLICTSLSNFSQILYQLIHPNKTWIVFLLINCLPIEILCKFVSVYVETCERAAMYKKHWLSVVITWIKAFETCIGFLVTLKLLQLEDLVTWPLFRAV